MDQQTRIIFVEGMQFTGKSTTSEYIATQLKLNGYPVQWLSEGMLLQRYFSQTLAMLMQSQPLSEPLMREEWSSFVEAVQAAEPVFVVDSALSYVAIAPLMFQDRPIDTIHAELRHIAELCAPLQPRVIHLTGDAERLVPASIVERGESWREQILKKAEMPPYQRARGRSGLAGAVSMLHESQELLGAVLRQDRWQTLMLDVMASDWTGRQQAALAFLGLDEVVVERPLIPNAVLQSYAGTYATDDSARPNKMLSVELEQDTLVMYSPGGRYGRLVPESPTRFHVQATTIDLEFVVEGNVVQQLTLLAPDGTGFPYRRS